jgi:hypothetical protein
MGWLILRRLTFDRNFLIQVGLILYVDSVLFILLANCNDPSGKCDCLNETRIFSIWGYIKGVLAFIYRHLDLLRALAQSAIKPGHGMTRRGGHEVYSVSTENPSSRSFQVRLTRFIYHDGVLFLISYWPKASATISINTYTIRKYFFVRILHWC